MKKILFITCNWLTDYGGKRIASTKIINNLSQNKFDVTVIDFEVGIESVSQLKIKQDINPNYKIHLLTYIIKKNYGLIPFLIKISKKYQFNIVICSGSAYFDIVTILTIKILNLFKKSRFILFSHTHPLKSIQFFSIPIKNFIFHIGYYVLSYFVYGLFDRIVTPSFGLKEFYVAHLRIKEEKISVINYPISNLRNHDKETLIKYRSSLLIPGNKKVIITAARLVLFQKDFITLFKALKEVNKKTDCLLVILGEGVAREKIKKLAKKLGVYSKISLLGFKKNPIDYIKLADVFVLSTFFEGFGIVLVEAMIGKVPVVSSDCDFGPREILENSKNGILVPVGDYKSMANSIMSLLEDNKLRKRFVDNGLNRIKFYSEKRSFKLWNKLLSEK